MAGFTIWHMKTLHMWPLTTMWAMLSDSDFCVRLLCMFYFCMFYVERHRQWPGNTHSIWAAGRVSARSCSQGFPHFPASSLHHALTPLLSLHPSFIYRRICRSGNRSVTLSQLGGTESDDPTITEIGQRLQWFGDTIDNDTRLQRWGSCILSLLTYRVEYSLGLCNWNS